MWNLVPHTKSRCPFGVSKNSKTNCTEDIIQPEKRLEKRSKLEVKCAKIKENYIAELNSAINSRQYIVLHNFMGIIKMMSILCKRQ